MGGGKIKRRDVSVDDKELSQTKRSWCSGRAAVLIMAGGVNEDETLPPHVESRIAIAEQLRNKTRYAICSSSFSLNTKVKLRSNGAPISECSAMAKALIESGWDESRVICEQQSHDTVGSLFFLLDMYLPIWSPWEAIIITSDFHLNRVKVIAEWMNMNLYDGAIRLQFIGSETKVGHSERQRHEEVATRSFLEHYEGIKSREEFFKRLIQTHSNYGRNFSGREVSPLELY